MSTAVTLALLQGPTKAAVASAITTTAAGFGTTFLAISPSTAFCYTFRQAYDDDVFKVEQISLSDALRSPCVLFNLHRRLTNGVCWFCRALVATRTACLISHLPLKIPVQQVPRTLRNWYE